MDELYEPLAVAMAREVLDMYAENQRLRRQLAEMDDYRKKYVESLQHGIDHNAGLIGTVLSALVDPESRISKAFAAEAKSAQS
jgi:hypothetical protein